MSIEAMKQALEALETATHQWEKEDAIASLRQAIEQAEKQEPVVWMYQDKSTHEVRFQKHMRGFVDHGATYETPLYTTPQPQREWVKLTPDEVFGIADQHPVEGFDPDIMAYTRAIEAKIKEKNT